MEYTHFIGKYAVATFIPGLSLTPLRPSFIRIFIKVGECVATRPVIATHLVLGTGSRMNIFVSFVKNFVR
jgi:hypothetical protein